MRAGTESYVMNYYRHFDRDRLQVDFLVHGDGKGDYDDEVLGLGGRIFSVPRRGMHPARNARAVEDFLRAHPYKLVHAHMDAGNYVPLKIAKRLGIPVRISHSHNTQYPTTDPLRLAWDKYQRNRIPAQATHLFACSTEAARWLYGEDWLPQTRIVHNAIDPDVFAYNKATRERVRRDLGLAQDDIALGHIGRFVDQKNHGFVLRMFAQLYERDPRYKLVLLGEGEKLSEMRQLAAELGIADAARFVGSTPRANEYYSAFDIFILPSLYEGLPVVAVEAQANGLPCLFSEGVPRESGIAGETQFVAVDRADSAEQWAHAIRALGRPDRNARAAEDLARAGYAIAPAAEELQGIYERLLAEAMC